MANEMKFAVVGLGMGKHHCIAVQNAEGARLAAVCDIDRDRLGKAQDEFGVDGYDSFEELLKNPEVDAVCIATESGKHSEMGIAAAGAGKHLIVEKPIDVTPAKIKALEDVVNKTGVKCGCIFQTRLNNCVRMLKKAIDRGDMGKVIGVHAHLPWFRAQSYYSGPHGSWKGTWELDGGGSLMNQGVHTLDLAVHLGGPVKRVAGLFGVFNHDIEAEDQAVAILEYENGALGTFYSTTCCHPDGTQHIFMYGSEGAFSMKGKLQSYDMGPQEERERMMALFSENPEADRLGSDPMAVSSDGHTLIVQDLVEAVRDDREPIIPIRDAKETVEVAYAIYESGRRGEFVNLSDVRE